MTNSEAIAILEMSISKIENRVSYADYRAAFDMGIQALKDVKVMQKEARTIAEDAYKRGFTDGFDKAKELLEDE